MRIKSNTNEVSTHVIYNHNHTLNSGASSYPEYQTSTRQTALSAHTRTNNPQSITPSGITRHRRGVLQHQHTLNQTTPGASLYPGCQTLKRSMLPRSPAHNHPNNPRSTTSSGIPDIKEV